MGCGCGGSSKVYKPHDAKKTVEPRSAASKGLPAVWNGPQPKTT